jgi:hypothetical protein
MLNTVNQQTIRQIGRRKEQITWVNTFSKVAGYKINTQILVAFLYTNNELCEKEVK